MGWRAGNSYDRAQREADRARFRSLPFWARLRVRATQALIAAAVIGTLALIFLGSAIR